MKDLEELLNGATLANSNSSAASTSESTEVTETAGTGTDDGSSSFSSEEITPTDGGSTIIINNPNFTLDGLKNTYLFGFKLEDYNGNPFPEDLIASYINSAIDYTEVLFDICLTPVEVKDEQHDYERSDYMNWGYIQLWKKPVREITRFTLMYGTRPSFDIPLDWLKIDKSSGKVQMFPSAGNVSNLIISGTGAIYGLHNFWDYSPQMWSVDYKAGMEEGEMPAFLKEFVYKKASIGVLQVYGDLILGAGIASQSLSIDGLSQSIGTTQSAMYGGCSARIDDYRKDMDSLIPVIRQKYQGMKMVVV
jgi:hypothetical protein